MSYDDTALVLTPYSWGSPAVELGNRQWRKKVLPVGDVQYQGRTLHFTPSYLQGLEDAFRDRAYDMVSFQLATTKNEHTNDPERHRGIITDMRAEPDGLWMYLNPTEAGDRVLSENPYLGVSARIVENYARSDGKFYPAAIQHVLGTLDPRIPALGSWQPTDLSNTPQMVVDLSNSIWLGEPGPPAATDMTLTDAELQDFLEVLDEVQAEEDLSHGYQNTEALADFDATFQHQVAADQARQLARADADLEDLMRPPRNDEDIVARAITRASAGIYDTSRVASFASPSTDAIELSTELTMSTGQGLCGDPDPFGRCSSRYHDLQCAHGTGTDWQASEPPRSTYAMALSNWASEHDLGPSPAAYGDGDDSHPIPANTLEFAHALNESWGLHADTAHLAPPPDFGELTGNPYAGDAYSAMAAEVGLDGLAGELPQRPDYPDVSELSRQMGLK